MYDVIVVGGGPGGYVAAIKASQSGLKTAIIEKEWYGGVCLNVGCIPTKTMLKSAKVYDDIKNSEKFGIEINGSVTINWQKIIDRRNKIVNKLVSGVEYLLDKNGVDKYSGEGKILSKTEVEVDGLVLKGENLILATGSKARLPQVKGAKEAFEKGFLLTSTEILDLKNLPKSLLILGGGVIGVEFATLFATFGTKVTIIQNISKILEFLDKDIIKEMTDILVDLGVEIRYDTKLNEIGSGWIGVEGSNGEAERVEGEYFLSCIGREANLDNLENLNLEKWKKGILTNERLETNIKGVYAIGDLNGRLQLAHVASHEGIVAIENICGEDSKIDYKNAPYCIYSFPEMAGIGLNEKDAREKYDNVKVAKFPLGINGKALAEGETRGFVKIIAEETYGEILGVHIIAAHATDMISEISTVMELEGTIYELAKAIHPHPTLSEVVMEAAIEATGKALHK